MGSKSILVLLSVLLFVCCGPEPSPEPSPEPTPDPAPDVTLSIDSESKSVSSSKGSFVVSVACNSSWSASSDKSWATLSSTSGTGDNTVTVNYTQNSESSSRTATITFTASGHVKTLALTQSASTESLDPVKWLKYIALIAYAADGITEASKTIYTYDIHGRETGRKSYSNGIIYLEQRNYSYSGKEAIYYHDDYINGILSSSRKCKVVFFDDHYYKLTSSVSYAADGITEASKTIYTYDIHGRQTGRKSYSNGIIYLEQRNYSYSGKEAIYYHDDYTSGVLNVTKCKTVFY